MDFFGDYSIETASCHPNSLLRPDDGVYFGGDLPPPSPLSPRAAGTSYPSAMVNMTDLTRHFTLQSLDTTCTEEAMPMPPSPTYSSSYSLSTRDPHISLSPVRRTSLTASRTMPCWKRRMQRQSQVRMLSDPAHLQSISEMVSRLSDKREVTPPSRKSTPTPAILLVDDDENDDEYISDSESPRSFSSSSSTGRNSAYFPSDHNINLHRRSGDGSINTSLAPRTPGIQKSRSRRAIRR